MTALPPIPRTPADKEPTPTAAADLVTLAIPIVIHVALGIGAGLLWNVALPPFGYPVLLWYQALCLWTLFLMAILVPAIVIMRILPAVRMVEVVKATVAASPILPPEDENKKKKEDSHDDVI